MEVKEKDQQKDMARGLGSNVGTADWQKTIDKKDKEKKFSEQLRTLNKKHGLLNAEKSPPSYKG